MNILHTAAKVNISSEEIDFDKKTCQITTLNFDAKITHKIAKNSLTLNTKITFVTVCFARLQIKALQESQEFEQPRKTFRN